MVSNTTQRIVSAFVMVIIASTALYYGRLSTLALMAIVGLLVNDEIYINFFKNKRVSFGYTVTQLLFVAGLYFISGVRSYEELFNFIGIFFNLGLLWYLFKTPIEKNLFTDIAAKFPVVIFAFALAPIISVSYLTSFAKWQILLLLLLTVNFGMDSGAWFFGKMMGKNKLWPEISPNKTIEGLIGGMVTAGLLGYLLCVYLLDKNAPVLILVFAGLGLLSQVGDLVQSKLKRQFAIKDSSSLIPGHGGVYDRIDSLVFVLPFFMGIVSIYY